MGADSADCVPKNSRLRGEMDTSSVARARPHDSQIAEPLLYPVPTLKH